MEAERKLEEKKLQDLRETSDRLTAASHVQVEYFAKHQKIEGYYESQMPGRLFGCDRLMKQDNMFGTLQLGYNPNRERVFLFANMKTSRYDTVASRYQKEMKEYQQKSLLTLSPVSLPNRRLPEFPPQALLPAALPHLHFRYSPFPEQ